MGISPADIARREPQPNGEFPAETRRRRQMYAGRGSFHYLQCGGAEVLHSGRRCTRTGDSPLAPHLRDGDMHSRTEAVFSAPPRLRGRLFFFPLKTVKSHFNLNALVFYNSSGFTIRCARGLCKAASVTQHSVGMAGQTFASSSASGRHEPEGFKERKPGVEPA